jgi:hypothetical protein
MRNEALARKNYLPWLTLARSEGLGLSLREMARAAGLTLRQVRTALANPAYQEFRDARLQMRVSALDAAFAEDNEAMRHRLRQLVPAALNAIERCLADPNRSVALRAAIEVLDHDERFNKAQNIGVTHQFTLTQEDKDRALAILEELKAAQPKDETKILDVEASPLAITPLLPKSTESD